MSQKAFMAIMLKPKWKRLTCEKADVMIVQTLPDVTDSYDMVVLAPIQRAKASSFVTNAYCQPRKTPVFAASSM